MAISLTYPWRRSSASHLRLHGGWGAWGMKFILTSMDTKNTKTKTLRKESSSSNEDLLEEAKVKVDFVPLHFVVKSRDSKTPLTDLSSSLVENTVKNLAGSVWTVKNLSNGLIHVHCLDNNQASKLLEVKELCQIPVSVEKYICKGVISCWDLLNCTVDEIREDVAEYNVVDVTRITRLENGERKPTYALILSFALPKLPTEIRVAFYTLKVTPYAPNPKRCYKCQRFGHIQSKCKKKEVCAECGMSAHRSSCKKKVRCVNCKGQHSSSSSECPAWKKQQAIQQLVTISRLPRKEARKQVNDETLLQGSSLGPPSEQRKTNKELQDLASVIEQQQQQLSELSVKLDKAMELLEL